MLAKMIFVGILERQNAKQFPLQFRDEIWVLDDIMLVVDTHVYTIYVLICDRYGVADKKDRTGSGSADMIVAGANIFVRQINKPQYALLLFVSSMV